MPHGEGVPGSAQHRAHHDPSHARVGLGAELSTPDPASHIPLSALQMTWRHPVRGWLVWTSDVSAIPSREGRAARASVRAVVAKRDYLRRRAAAAPPFPEGRLHWLAVVTLAGWRAGHWRLLAGRASIAGVWRGESDAASERGTVSECGYRRAKHWTKCGGAKYGVASIQRLASASIGRYSACLRPAVDFRVEAQAAPLTLELASPERAIRRA